MLKKRAKVQHFFYMCKRVNIFFSKKIQFKYKNANFHFSIFHFQLKAVPLCPKLRYYALFDKK